jgi:hypothetical protein
MRQTPFRHHAFAVLVLAIAAGPPGCAAEDSDEDTGAGTGTDTSAGTMPADDTMPPPTTNPMDDGDDGTTDPPAEDDAPAEDATTDPGTSGMDDNGDDMASTGADDSTGASGVNVSGTVRRNDFATIGFGNDGIGTLYLGVLVACSQDAESVAGYGVPDVDVSSTANVVDWTIPNVPDGHYFIAAFLDDNGNADPNDPYADMGDLAAAEGFGPACLEIEVAGADVEAGEITLNIAVPF